MTPPEDHSSAVARYAGAIARNLGWAGEELGLIRLAGMLHDVGKIAIPDRILLKPTALTPEEQHEYIKRHPILGAELVSRVEGLGPAVMWIRHSHENWDGTGYPDGLSAEAIPLGSRILNVAQAFAAMTGRRTYRIHGQLRGSPGGAAALRRAAIRSVLRRGARGPPERLRGSRLTG